MPKRHRQPEPIDIHSAAHRSHNSASSSSKNNFAKFSTASNTSSSLKTKNNNTTTTAAPDDKSAYSPGELKLVEKTRKKAVDFPATPETLSRHRRLQEADAKRRRVSYDRDGQPLSEAGVLVAAAAGSGRRGVGTGGYNGVEWEGKGEDGDMEEEAQYNSDLSSNDYVGDDGNQPSMDSELDSDEGDDGEAELRGLRRAMAAAAVHQRRTGRVEQDDDTNDNSNSGSSAAESDDGGSDEVSDEAFNSEEEEEDDSNDGEENSDMSMEEEEDGDEEVGPSGAVQRGSEEDDEDDDDNDRLITVDFGVFDMQVSNIDGLIHLMDQLCPDKMNEVDRDELGLALYESPFTSVVRLQNNGEDATGEEAQEFYGLSSVLDVAHGQELYPKALRPLCELLQQHVWRRAAAGIPPTDILTSVVDYEHAATSRAKCLLLISEYIRNIPLELTVQILEDILNRLDAAGRDAVNEKAKTTTGATHDDPVFATQPSMFAVLAKVQRATDAPVTLPKSGKQPQQQQEIREASGEAGPSSPPTAARKHHSHGKKADKAGGSGTMAAPEAPLDLTHYIFWREEDSILYEFRDKRVAALVYRCRPQYDGQPEHEIPLSILFVLQYGAVRQAVDEMKRRQTVNASVERY